MEKMEATVRIESDYHINKDTNALRESNERPGATMVYEKNRTIHVAKRPLDLIKEACLRDGWAGLDGRRQAVRKNMAFDYKVPVPVIPKLELFLFPTHGLNNPVNTWINPDAVTKCVAGSYPDSSFVQLEGGEQIEVLLKTGTLHSLYIMALRCQNKFSGNDPFHFT